MGKTATNLDEQIDILSKRGMILNLEIDKIKEILLDIGYYRLGFYWCPFEIDNNHNFKEGTKFSEIVDLYYLDTDLRHLLLKYIYRIELNFRTKLIYITSNKYNESPTWFVDSKVVEKNFIDNFDRIVYNETFKQNLTIRKHHINNINDKYAPAWKTIEYMTFGNIITLFENLKSDQTKTEITKSLNLRKINILLNFIKAVKFIRDVCSHSSILFDCKQPKAIKRIPQEKYVIHDKQNLDASIKVILFMLSLISSNRENELKDSIKDLFSKYISNENIKWIIETRIGYKYDYK